MNSIEQADLFQTDTTGDRLDLGQYARQAYLEYALSVVKGRALPQVSDGQKPVQRRILYAMLRLGLAWQGANGAKPVKSARVVGDVLGRYHPHGDQAAYDALVRMAQSFAQRYPLVDGQGNFGSRDGDGAAAMRYTEARLTPLARLLMEELDEGTVAFRPNYDGSTEEPIELPARLPFVLLNGASGIAVGLATEIPSHNLGEVAAAAVALLKDPALSDNDLFALLPGPDFPGGAQVISAPEDIRAAYTTGRGSLKLRARWKVEDLARGQWQLVITELPHGVSSQRVLEEIEEISNPKVKAGKKAATPEQLQLKNTLLAVLDGVRDESSKDAAVRLVFEPKSRTVSVEAFGQVLLAHTSLETSSSINLTMVGLDGKPVPKSLRQMLLEWLQFRQTTIERRSRHRLAKAEDRIHILEGRQQVLLNIDEVIRIVRHSDEPKPALIEHFRLSDRQAEDILEIRLRQLARLEAIKIEQELKQQREEADKLRDILGNPATLKRLLVREIEADAKQFGDARRTLIQAEKRAAIEIKVLDEPVTVVVSQKGWVRALKGHDVDVTGLAFKAGDALYGSFACRTVDTLIALGTTGRSYSVPVSVLPGGRGDGAPMTSLIELESGTQLLHYVAGPATQSVVLAGSAGFGLVATIESLSASKRAGKAFLSLDAGELPLRPAIVTPARPCLAVLSEQGRLLTFPVTELKVQPKGGRGLTLIDLESDDRLLAMDCFATQLRLTGVARGNKPREEVLRLSGLIAHAGKRARKGKAVEGFKQVLQMRGL